jgi:hypothetical protein
VVTVTVGAGVAGDGGEFWIHPAKRMQSRNVRKIRGRETFFMARGLYQYLLTSLSHFFSKHIRMGKVFRWFTRRSFF